jgi:hypothetical protein
MAYYTVARHPEQSCSDRKTPKGRDDEALRAEDRDRKRATRASEGALYRPDFCMWFKDRVDEVPWTGDYVWDRQLASAIRDGSESDRSLCRYYEGKSKHPGAALAYAIGWALHDVGLNWCSGPIALLAGGHAECFFELLAYLASRGSLNREAALRYAFGSFQANAPIKANGVAIQSPHLLRNKGFFVRGQLERRTHARNAVRIAAQQRSAIEAAWKARKSRALRKVPGDFKYAFETVKARSAVNQEVRIAGALIMIAASIESQDSERDVQILQDLQWLSPMAAVRRLLSIESEVNNRGR